MSLFVDQKLDYPHQVSGFPVGLSWHSSLNTIASISYNDNLQTGSVLVFTENGAVVALSKPRNRNSFPECLAWHPTKNWLVVGWKDGMVSQYDFENEGAHEHLVSNSAVTTVLWNASGNFCVAVNKNNRIFGWMAGSNGLFLPKPSYTADSPQSISCIVFMERLLTYSRSRKSFDNTVGSLGMQTSSNLDVLVGGNQGGLYSVTDWPTVTEVIQLGDAVISMKCFEVVGSRSRTAVVITAANRVIRYSISSTFALEEKLTISLTGKSPLSSVCWLGIDLLAVASVEDVINIWDVSKGESFQLATTQLCKSDTTELVRSVAYNSFSGTLAGATNIGSVLFWQMHPNAPDNQTFRYGFFPLGYLKLTAEVRTFTSSAGTSAFAAISAKHAYILQQRPLAYSFLYPFVAVQSAADAFFLANTTSQRAANEKVTFAVDGLIVGEKTVVVWGESKAILYQISSETEEQGFKLTEMGSFEKKYLAMAVHGSNAVAITSDTLSILSMQGITKFELRVQSVEGDLQLLSVRNSMCAVATSGGYLKLWNLSKVDTKHWTKSKLIRDSVPLFGEFSMININSDASFVGFLVQKLDKMRDTCVYLWNTERNVVLHYECSPSIDPAEKSVTSKISLCTINNARPLSIEWQGDDPRMLCACMESKDIKSGNEKIHTVIATFFSTSEKGLLLNSIMTLEDPGQVLMLGCQIPFVYLYTNPTTDPGKLAITRRFLPDYSGFQPENVDDLKIVLDFSYYSCLGKISEALSAAKSVKNVMVWHHLARLCVRLGKLDYAKVCLGKLGRVDLLEDLRHFAKDNADPDLQLGRLALMLQLPEEAETMFQRKGRPDLIQQYRLASGDWSKVMDNLSLSTIDRLRRRAVLHNMARDDVQFGEVDAAITRLVEANCEAFDVPRLMLRMKPNDLENYIEKQPNRKIITWYAQLLESQNQPVDAMEYCRKAGDIKSIVRMLTQTDQIDAAIDLVRSSKNSAGAFQLAHTLEVEDEVDPQLIIEMYLLSEAYSSAIRICMQYELDDQIMPIALKGDKPGMVVAAKYLERRGYTDKAISLYHKAGYLSQASDLAFEQGYYTNIETISEDITEHTDPKLIERCVEYFAGNNQVDRAVQVLLRARKVNEAVDLSIRYQMTFDERFISTILEHIAESKMDASQRVVVTEKLAGKCLEQGLYHDAARMLIEIGRPEAAMNAIAKTGDTDAITRYIRIIRDPTALTVAGNNLQAHPWHQKREIFDAIVLAYKRAGAHLYLASFYDSWGETACESDQYDTASEAFGKSLDVMKSVNPTRDNSAELDRAKEEVEIKKKVVDYYLDVRHEAESNAPGAVAAAEELLKHTKWDSGVRTGHVFAFLIRMTLKEQSFAKSRKYLQRLMDSCPASQSLADFLDQSIIDKVTQL
ncbi:intraflagellar transport protein 140 homolog [Paramacrobiotus metropolitanus]|uniref:intraflagellar transport protein 140 homolog n=1 Tax=Paramacrobiotus metropolitanus TaxID=2943436 RepID=UPI0024460E6F|nr:intraflagellar transport protein 140 homolog [Paramacrobiotus metropolitanus]